MFGSKVLIVDDDPELVALVSTWLRKEGLDTCNASDGVGALMQVRKEQPDLIILDLGLPAGDGMVTLERLKRSSASSGIPVLVLSAQPAAEAEKRALEAGAHTYLEKRGNRADFIAAVNAALDHDAAPDSFA